MPAPELTCIICGEPSNGYHFCKTCYAKYGNHPIDLRIMLGDETEILDEWGNRKYKTESGVYVRSISEKTVMDWLWANDIRAVYEKEVFYKEKRTGEKKALKPDFYLPKYNLYIEFNGLTDPEYLKIKEYSMEIYKEKKMKVIVLNGKSIRNLDKSLGPELLA